MGLSYLEVGGRGKREENAESSKKDRRKRSAEKECTGGLRKIQMAKADKSSGTRTLMCTSPLARARESCKGGTVLASGETLCDRKHMRHGSCVQWTAKHQC